MPTKNNYDARALRAVVGMNCKATNEKPSDGFNVAELARYLDGDDWRNPKRQCPALSAMVNTAAHLYPSWNHVEDTLLLGIDRWTGNHTKSRAIQKGRWGYCAVAMRQVATQWFAHHGQEGNRSKLAALPRSVGKFVDEARKVTMDEAMGQEVLSLLIALYRAANLEEFDVIPSLMHELAHFLANRTEYFGDNAIFADEMMRALASYAKTGKGFADLVLTEATEKYLLERAPRTEEDMVPF